MLDKLIADLGDMHKAVLVHAQIDERTEVDNIAHGAGQLHAGLEIFQAHNIAAQQGLGQAVAYVAARLTQLGHDVVQRRLANAQRLAQVLGALSLDGGRQTRQFVAADLGSGVAAGIQQGLGGGVAFGVDSGGVQAVFGLGQAQEARALLIGFGAEALDLFQLGTGSESPLLLTPGDDIFNEIFIIPVKIEFPFSSSIIL